MTTITTTEKAKLVEPILRVMFDMTREGIQSARIFASNANLRDEGARRLMAAMPILEMLEAKLKEPLQTE